MIRNVAGVPRHLAGCIKNAPGTDNYMRYIAAPSSSAYTMDWPVPIRDQGAVGDCVANMYANLVDHLEAKAGRTFRSSVFFSYALARELEGKDLSNDSGLQIRDMFTVGAQVGSVSEDEWPSEPQDRYSVSPPPDIRAMATHKGLLFLRLEKSDGIKRSILDNCPVGFGFDVYTPMESSDAAESGLVRLPTPADIYYGRHAVTAIGFDDGKVIPGADGQLASVGAFLCVNSWGADWGQGGKFWLPYGYWEGSMAEDCTTLRRIA